MKFNVDKCYVMHIGTRNERHEYRINGQVFHQVEAQNALGVVIKNDLKMSDQCAKANAKASRVLGIIDNCGLNTRWCLTSLLLSLSTAVCLGQRSLIPAGLPHTTAQYHLTILGETVLFCLNHPSFRTPGSLFFCCHIIIY